MKFMTHSALALSAIALASLTACGGGGGDDNDTPATSTTSATAFPTGVSVGSPTALGSSGSVVTSMNISPAQKWQDWALATWDAIQQGNWPALQHLATVALPLGNAWADADKVPEAKITASEVEAVVSGKRSLAQIGLSLNDLFAQNSNNASCFGPQVAYVDHDNSGSAEDGTLPTGDLGIWRDTEGNTSEPCAAAQLNARLSKVKKQTRQAMLMMAAMRRAIAASSSLSMPTAGNQTDLASSFATTINALLSGASINAATVALNSDGSVYTYRLVISRGTGAAAETAEVVIKHTPGASETAFTGVMSVTVSQLANDPAFGCTDQTASVGGGTYNRVASVSTLRYNRDGDSLKFSNRSGQYCGAPSDGSSSHLAELAAVDSNGELDPSVKLSGNTRGATLGWRGNFSRFAGDMNKETQAGDFLYVWQAGTGDSHGRAFAVHSAYNSATDARTLDAYAGYTDQVAGSPSSLLGMICNWAGPGNNHTPAALFQRQSMSISASATSWTLGTSKISYAPTTSCNSSSLMSFDQDANGSVTAGEGASVTHDLDSKGSSSTVQAELESRGYAIPTLF